MRPSLAVFVGVWLAFTAASLAITFLTGVRVNLLGMAIFWGSAGAVVAYFAKEFYKSIDERVHPETPQVAREQSLFSPLVNFAESMNGVFEGSGRAGKARIVDGDCEYTLTVRKSTMQGPKNSVLMVVSAPLESAGFQLELSAQPIRRKDLDEFPSGNEALDAAFSMASNEVAQARIAIDSVAKELIGFGKDLSISTRRGAIEIKSLLPDFDEHNIVRMFETFKTLHGSINGPVNSPA